MLLKQDRSADDNLKHKLNGIDTKDYRECVEVAKWLGHMHAARRRCLEACIEEVERMRESGNVHVKEVGLLRSELVIEDIVEENSWALFHERCRIVGDYEKYKYK
jgi:hypothetical protein